MGDLLSGHKMELLKVIAKEGWDVGCFIWSTHADKIEYRPTKSSSKFFFSVSLNGGYFELKMCPGRSLMNESRELLNRAELTDALKSWLGYLQKELNDESLFASTISAVGIIRGDGAPFGVVSENAHFSKEEGEELRRKLQEALEKIDTLDQMAQEDRKFVQDKIRELQEAIGKVKKDGWVDMCKGAMAGALIGAFINRENVVALLGLVSKSQ